MRAMMSLRLDRFFGSWLNEFSPDYTPGETGMDRFISFTKNADFVGRAAAEGERAKGAARKLVAFEVDAMDADVNGYEPVWIGEEVRGFCTSGGYSRQRKLGLRQKSKSSGTSGQQGCSPRHSLTWMAHGCAAEI
jgi:dimethylglycine dehydrogenase